MRVFERKSAGIG